jgi:Mrp family chromosome partitioning ATPase
LQSEPADDSRVTTLSQEQKTLLDQRATLLQQRSELSAAARAPGPVSIFIPVDLPVPQAPSNLLRLLAVAAFLGLLLGAAIAYGLALRRRTFADAAEIELVVHAPLLAEIPDFSSPRRSAVSSTFPEPSTQATEAFRMVASAIASRAERTHATTFVVVSALRNEGKTTVAANTAVTAALEGARVLVVDADPRRHGLTTLLESSAAGALVERAERLNERLVRMVTLPNATLDLLSMTGPPSVNSWRSDAVRKFFQDMREAYDLVLIDTPDLLSASEASAVALHADGAVFVVAEGAGVAEVTEAVSRLHLIGLEPIGYVHNLARTATRRTDRRSNGVANGS